MTLEQLEVWYKGCTEHYLSTKEKLAGEMVSTIVQPAIQITQPVIPKPKTPEYINCVKTIQLLEQFNWGTRPMNSYLITFENFNGSFILNCATAAEQKQPVAGSIIKHQLKGTKLVSYKFIKI
jgi:hypothetical protein